MPLTRISPDVSFSLLHALSATYLPVERAAGERAEMQTYIERSETRLVLPEPLCPTMELSSQAISA